MECRGGMASSIWNRIYVDLTVFSTQGNNMIRTVPNLQPRRQDFIFENIGKFTFNGSELDLNAYIFKNLTMTVPTIPLPIMGSIQKGKPGQKINLGITYNGKPVQAKISLSHIIDYFADDHSQNPIPALYCYQFQDRIPFGKTGKWWWRT